MNKVKKTNKILNLIIGKNNYYINIGRTHREL